jgi:hypothetical protein
MKRFRIHTSNEVSYLIAELQSGRSNVTLLDSSSSHDSSYIARLNSTVRHSNPRLAICVHCLRTMGKSKCKYTFKLSPYRDGAFLVTGVVQFSLQIGTYLGCLDKE